VKNQLQPEDGRRKTFQSSNALIVIHLVITPINVLRRQGREGNMQQQPMLMKIHHTRRQKSKLNELANELQK